MTVTANIQGMTKNDRCHPALSPLTGRGVTGSLVSFNVIPIGGNIDCESNVARDKNHPLHEQLFMRMGEISK